MKKVSCIIPAYNEEKNIGNVLNVIYSLLDNLLFEVIVIDDCSFDKTKKIVEKFPKVKLIINNINLGKSISVSRGIKLSKGNYIFLLDADLLNLTKKNIVDIIAPILDNTAQVTFSYIKNSWPLFPFKKIDYCSGQRVIQKKIIQTIFEEMENLSSYGLEIFINKLIIKNKLRLKVIYWSNVENDFHNIKGGFIKGWIKNLRIWKDIILTAGGIIEIYKINIDLEKLLIDTEFKKYS